MRQAHDRFTHEVVALKRVKLNKEREGFPITALREVTILLRLRYVDHLHRHSPHAQPDPARQLRAPISDSEFAWRRVGSGSAESY